MKAECPSPQEISLIITLKLVKRAYECTFPTNIWRGVSAFLEWMRCSREIKRYLSAKLVCLLTKLLTCETKLSVTISFKRKQCKWVSKQGLVDLVSYSPKRRQVKTLLHCSWCWWSCSCSPDCSLSCYLSYWNAKQSTTNQPIDRLQQMQIEDNSNNIWISQ